MNERLRTLSPPLRLTVYIAGVLLLFIIAGGIGATAALVIGWQVGAGSTGSVVNGSFEGGKAETTGIGASEGTAIEPSSESTNSSDTVDKSSFTQRAKQKNSRGDYTYIGDPSINDDADAIVSVSLTSDRSTSNTTAYGHNIGVWYEPVARKWAVFNQDRAPVPRGTTFKVVVPPASTKFMHRADLLNTAGYYTYLDNKLTNGQPNAELTVTQNWNPGGGKGVYNDHPVGTRYDAKLEKWAVYNRDGAPIPRGACFNIVVSPGPNHSRK
jgi:hypothetical protein